MGVGSLSPIMFNIAIDTLHLLMKKAHEHGLIQNLAQHLIRVNMLKYADYTNFMFKE